MNKSSLLTAWLVSTLALPVAAAPLERAAIQKSVAAYAQKRGVRLQDIGVRVLQETDSHKSTKALVTLGGKTIEVAVNHKSGRVQSQATAELTEALLAANRPLKRAGLGRGAPFANRVITYRPGPGATLRNADRALGRPRAQQSRLATALDAVSLGTRGSIELGLAKPVVAGTGAGVRVRENGLGSAADIINQTPGLVELYGGGKWYRLGHAGYKTLGDALLTQNALDPIPAGTVMTKVRITDDPSAPHPRGIDPTDNATAAARGVKGFDLVSVEVL